MRSLSARYSKDWKPTPWPGEDQPASAEASQQEAASVAHRHAGLIERIRRRKKLGA